MANLGPMFFGSYEIIPKHMETYEQKIDLKRGGKEGEIKQHLKNYCLLDTQFQH